MTDQRTPRVRTGARRLVVAVAALALSGVSAAATGATAAPSAPKPRAFQLVRPLSTSRVAGFKSLSARVARSDTALLAARGTAMKSVVVKLDYDAIAAYRGNLRGLAATSPEVTGQRLDVRSTAARSYGRYVDAIDARFRQAASQLAGVRLGRSLKIVYGGVALRLPANQITALTKLPGVAAIQRDALNQPQSSETEFVGANALYPQLGGQPDAGKGIIFGDLDTGVWPENPSLADLGNLPAPPPAPSGQPRACDFEDVALPRQPRFRCNNKLIGGAPFLETYNSVLGDEPYATSARDSDGHGTHTTTTAAGNARSSAPIFGINRGPVSGIAPGAYVISYKVCGIQGCFGSDSAAAVAQAVLDGVNVINFSISGGSNPYQDPVELAFLDAEAAGVFTAASAGNSGPDPATTDHLGPWVTTVAASTQSRAYVATATIRSSDGARLVAEGASITPGISTPTPVVLATAIGLDDICSTPAAPGSATGKIVVCIRGGTDATGAPVGRVQKGFNVKQGGAAGMFLVNPVTEDTETDNHFLPVVHFDNPAGQRVIDFLAAHRNVTATFVSGQKRTGFGDVMAAFSSRGPSGPWLKPNITSTGVQVLGGTTPTPFDVASGPPGQSYQAIAGTSMSAPNIAGSAVLLKALHPTWTPMQIQSALMTTANERVVKQDGVTPADPFDFGGGREDLSKAGDPGLTFGVDTRDFLAAETNTLNRVDLNLASVYSDQVPGRLETTRRAVNVTAKPLTFRASGSSNGSLTVTVKPAVFTVQPGQVVDLRITLDMTAAPIGGFSFGRIDLVEQGGTRRLHVPVAAQRGQGSVSLASSCTPSSIGVGGQQSTCTITAQNQSLTSTTASLRTDVGNGLAIDSVSGATRQGARTAVLANQTLGPRSPDAPRIVSGTTPGGGFLDLAAFGVTPSPIGDEEIQNLDVPPFVYAGGTYTTVGIVSNGYAVAGGGDSSDVDFVPQTFPNPARPNNVIAPLWTDLDGTGSPGISAALLSDSSTGDSWVVLQWDVHVFGSASSVERFQVWIGVNGTEDVSVGYGTVSDPVAAGAPFNAGAENADGSAGDNVAGLPASDFVVQSTPGVPGGTASYTVTVHGVTPGPVNPVRTQLLSPSVRGTTVDVQNVAVVPRGGS